MSGIVALKSYHESGEGWILSDMRPKEIGFVGFDNASGSHLMGAADTFAAAWLDDGFGGRIPCYRVWALGLTKEHFITESGFVIYPHKTLATAPLLDTIVIAGGSGARRPEVIAQVGTWVLGRAYKTRLRQHLWSGSSISKRFRRQFNKVSRLPLRRYRPLRLRSANQEVLTVVM